MADDSIAKDFGTLLAANGFGTVGTDIFEGFLPAGKGNCLATYDTRGMKPVRTSAKTTAAERPGLMIHVQNADYETGYQKTQAIRKFLQTYVGLAGTGTYLDVTATTTVLSLGQIEIGYYVFSINFMLTRVPQ